MSILVVDNHRNVEDALSAFDIGADDVLDPRMQADEVVSRILSVASRRAGYAGPVIRKGNLKVDLRARRAYWGPQAVDLSPSQYEIFELLCLNNMCAVSKDQIMGQLYGVDEGPDPRVIDVFICKIRAKFEAAGAPSTILSTLRGRGITLYVEEDAWTEDDMPLPISDKIVPLDIKRAA
jgi:DNA-binding response OmpR family regulator